LELLERVELLRLHISPKKMALKHKASRLRALLIVFNVVFWVSLLL